MGLSTKQVYGENGLDWSQTLLESGALELPKLPPVRRQQSQQQQSEPVACPRCGSINTKFCYYNNYNKSQPRHFCKACKRHWTKGGTLRNVPVGGARKNKRLKTSNSTTTTTAAVAAATATTMTESTNTHWSTVQSQQQCENVPLTLGDQKNSSEILYQALLRPPYSSQHDATNSFRGKSISGINGIFKGSTFSASQSQNLHFPFSRLSSINADPSPLSASFQPSSGYNSGGGLKTIEDSTITTVMPSASSINISQPWQVPPTSTVMDMANYWNWDDIDTLVSTDLNIPWDDTEIKP